MTVGSDYPDLVPQASPPDWLLDIPFAHRGLHAPDGPPENSLGAFRAAARAGYAVELDVSLSRDGVPVVAHDVGLARVAGRPERVRDLTVAELASVSLLGSHEPVPTLAASLGVLTEVPVMVEIKQAAPRAGALEAAVAPLLDAHPGPVCVAGFNPFSLRWFLRSRPEVVRVLTAGPINGTRLPRVVRSRLAELKDLPRVRPHAVSYELSGLPNPACDAWRGRGGAVLAWTVDDEASLARARSLVDNVIFEHVTP